MKGEQFAPVQSAKKYLLLPNKNRGSLIDKQ